MTTTSCAQFGEEKNLWTRHIDQRIIQQQAFRLAPHVVRSLVLLHLLYTECDWFTRRWDRDIKWTSLSQNCLTRDT